MSTPMLEVDGARKHFGGRRRLSRTPVEPIRAVDDVSFTVLAGQTCGLVGESGSGKSTIGRLVVRLLEPDGGRILIDGTDISALDGAALRRARRQVQMVFQDPYSSLDPTSTIEDSIAEPLRTHLRTPRSELHTRVRELCDLVGLPSRLMGRRPSQLSGGQLQRAAVARGLAVSPKLLVLDEPVSALDVSTQAQVLNLLVDLQVELGLTYLFISHDLAVVRHISDSIVVLHRGEIVEQGTSDEVYEGAQHPYTQRLLAAARDPVGLADSAAPNPTNSQLPRMETPR